MRILLAAALTLFLGSTGLALADMPGADWMKPEQVTKTLESAGYSNITGLEADDGYWEGKGLKNGKIMEFHADPRTGTIVTEKLAD